MTTKQSISVPKRANRPAKYKSSIMTRLFELVAEGKTTRQCVKELDVSWPTLRKWINEKNYQSLYRVAQSDQVTFNHENCTVHGYPTSVIPFNTMYDVKRKLPLFTKSNKSKSAYCAGYYIIQFDKGWVKSFCPKLITIERYNFKGPFKTEIEMRQELRRAKN